jgi:hypothetical protein
MDSRRRRLRDIVDNRSELVAGCTTKGLVPLLLADPASYVEGHSNRTRATARRSIAFNQRNPLMTTIPMPDQTIEKFETDPVVPPPVVPPADVVAVNRRTIDGVLIGAGILAIVVLAVTAGLLTWGNQFADDYVGRELSSQNITFPSAEELTGQGRDDLVQYADQPLDTGKEAEAYASFIDGHLEGIADGATYADLGAPESAAKDAVTAAVDAGSPQAEIDELQATADGVSGQRNSLFKGETLRGLLLSAYAWSTVGMIAGIAAIAAYIATALMAVLVGLGLIHRRRTTNNEMVLS